MSATRDGELVVLYDAACGFCIWTVNLFLRMDRSGRLVPAPIQECTSTLLRDLDRVAALRSFHTVPPGARRDSAGAALATLLSAMPPLRGLGTVLRRVPRLAGRLYWLVASRRARLVRLVPGASLARGRRLVEHALTHRAPPRGD